ELPALSPLFLLVRPRPPRSTLFPYTTLFRSTVAEWKKRGYQPISDLSPDAKAVILKLDGQHGEEYWLGLQNFYVITRYNRSHLYSMAVHQLSQLIKEKMEAGQ